MTSQVRVNRPVGAARTPYQQRAAAKYDGKRREDDCCDSTAVGQLWVVLSTTPPAQSRFLSTAAQPQTIALVDDARARRDTARRSSKPSPRPKTRSPPFARHDIDDRVGVLGGFTCRELGAVRTPQLVGSPLTPVWPRRLGCLSGTRCAGQCKALTC